jgi:hypothetical protein
VNYELRTVNWDKRPRACPDTLPLDNPMELTC